MTLEEASEQLIKEMTDRGLSEFAVGITDTEIIVYDMDTNRNLDFPASYENYPISVTHTGPVTP